MFAGHVIVGGVTSDTVVVAVSMLLPLTGSLTSDVTTPWHVNPLHAAGAVTVIVRVSVTPLPRLAMLQTPVAELNTPCEFMELEACNAGNAGKLSVTTTL